MDSDIVFDSILVDSIIIDLNNIKGKIKHVLDCGINDIDTNEYGYIIREVLSDSYSRIKNNQKLLEGSKSMNLPLGSQKSLIDNNFNALNYIIITLYTVYEKKLYNNTTNELYTGLCLFILNSWHNNFIWITKYHDYEMRKIFMGFINNLDKLLSETLTIKELNTIKSLEPEMNGWIDIIYNPDSDSNDVKSKMTLFQHKINHFIQILNAKNFNDTIKIMKYLKKLRMTINIWIRVYKLSDFFYNKYYNKLQNPTNSI
jgi:hypothetical protein